MKLRSITTVNWELLKLLPTLLKFVSNCKMQSINFDEIRSYSKANLSNFQASVIYLGHSCSIFHKTFAFFKLIDCEEIIWPWISNLFKNSYIISSFYIMNCDYKEYKKIKEVFNDPCHILLFYVINYIDSRIESNLITHIVIY